MEHAMEFQPTHMNEPTTRGAEKIYVLIDTLMYVLIDIFKSPAAGDALKN